MKLTRPEAEAHSRSADIADDFRQRCGMSSRQGVRFCDTWSIVEENRERVTPIESVYKFDDKEVADMVSTHLHTHLAGERFEALQVSVEPLPGRVGRYHIRIRAEW